MGVIVQDLAATLQSCLQKPVMVQFEKIKDRHPEWSSANARCRVPVHARFWREWADQRVSRPEGPCVVTTRLKLHLYPKAVQEALACSAQYEC